MGNYRFENLSQDDLRKLVESLDVSDVPIFCIEPDTNEVIYANPAWTNHADRLHKNFRAGMPLESALQEEIKNVAGKLPENAQKAAAKAFTDVITNGGQFEFGAPDGKLYRGHYAKTNNLTLGVSFDVTEIKTRRADAKKAKQTLQSTLDGLHHGVMLYDETGHVSFFNDSFYTTTSGLGIHIEKGMFHLELRDQLPSDLKARLLENGRGDLGDFEFIQKAPNGKHYLFESRRLENGTVLVSTVDVSELQEKRAENKKIRATLEQTLDGLTHGVMLIDQTGHVAYANESIRRFAAETGAQIEKGMHVSKIRENVPHQDPEGTTTPNGDYEYVVKGRNGKSFLVRRRFLPKIGILVSTVDITELEEQRAQTKRFGHMLEQSMEGMPHGVLLYDVNGNVEMFNNVFKHIMHGMNLKIEKGMHFIDVSAQIPENFREELAGKDPGEPFEIVQKGLDGKSYLIEGRGIKNVGFLITTVDITEQQEALEAAKAADIAKTSFLANMSHEIRTPMNGVLGMAQVLEQTSVDDHQRKCIDIIKSSSELLLRIINDILDISKLDAAKIDIEAEPFDLEDVINSAAAIVKPKLIEKQGLEIILDIQSDSELDYLGDKGRIRQILINLLGNGVKFTDTGHVKLTAKTSQAGPDKDQITIQVEDTGIGIAPDKIDKIFERFEQSDMSTTRQYGGTGLGLSISRKLARLMGGELKVCEERKQGACFALTLTLPRQEKSKSSPRPVIRSYKDIPVLIIDDNKVNHMVLSHQLEALKVKTFCVDSAKKGLSVLRKMAAKNFKIPLVICDYQMPEKTGYDFVKILKSDPTIADTPVIIISSADILSRQKDFIELGVSKVLEKPCSKSEIITAASEELYKFFTENLEENRVEITAPLHAANIVTPNRKRILVADDDPVNREVFNGFLNLFGYESIIVNNGLEAVKAFAENAFDLVIMDISMPVLGGQEAAQKIRRFERENKRNRTPIIAVTAHALKGDREKFLACGMDDYLPKPILKTDLQELIDVWLDRPAESGSIKALAS